ncbi:MAG: pilus assembly protein CpaB, partial [Nocardioides sp.]
TLAGPVARGEPLTGVRVVRAPLAHEALAGTDRLALPVRLPGAGAVGLLRVGDRIDLVATDPQGATSEVVAQGVPVLALPGPDSSTGAAGPAGPAGGRLVVVGVAADELAQVSTAAAATFLTYAWTR